MNLTVKRVPSEYHSGIESLASLDSQVADSFVNALHDLPPVLDREKLAVEVVARSKDLDEETVKDLLRVLFSLYDLRANADISADELAIQICKAVKEDEELSHLSQEQIKNLEKRLKLLLDSDGTIGASYKAQIILTDHKCVFDKARIFSDMRPIFESDVAAEPIAIGIVHTLKVEYRTLDGSKELFVALDSVDLTQINKEIQRAIDKEKTIRSMLNRVNLRCLGEEKTD